MVRELDGADVEALHHDLWAVQDEVELAFGGETGEGGGAVDIGIDQVGGGHEKFEFVIAPESVEVARYNHGLADFAEKGV